MSSSAQCRTCMLQISCDTSSCFAGLVPCLHVTGLLGNTVVGRTVCLNIMYSSRYIPSHVTHYIIASESSCSHDRQRFQHPQHIQQQLSQHAQRLLSSSAKFCVALQICIYRLLHFLPFCLFASALRGPYRLRFECHFGVNTHHAVIR